MIEHVGGPWRRRALATQARALAPHHWIQTPARTFPIEPHWLFPYFQILPLRTRAWVSRHWPLGQIRSEGREQSIEDVLDIELLTVDEMRHLFPDSELVRERAMGMTKSLIAVH